MRNMRYVGKALVYFGVLCLISGMAVAQDWSDWQLVSSDPLVQVRWQKAEAVYSSGRFVQFKSDQDVTVRYVATIEKKTIEGGYVHRVTDRVSGTIRVPRNAGGEALVSEAILVKDVTGSIVK